MRFYDLHERYMGEETRRALADLIGQPRVACRECSRDMYHGFAGVICWECTNR